MNRRLNGAVLLVRFAVWYRRAFSGLRSRNPAFLRGFTRIRKVRNELARERFLPGLRHDGERGAGDVYGGLSLDISTFGVDVYSFTLASFDEPIF